VSGPPFGSALTGRYEMLANRVYLGEAVHKGVAYPGEHAAIVDQRTWDKAHAVMAEPARQRAAATRAQVPALLKGLIFGPNGRPMSPIHSRRCGRIYSYSCALQFSETPPCA
jgi:site-specific DNA recombinase